MLDGSIASNMYTRKNEVWLVVELRDIRSPQSTASHCLTHLPAQGCVTPYFKDKTEYITYVG
jgi:hypothetical protein